MPFASFKKKPGNADDEDTNRSALFGSRKKGDVAPPSKNPYASVAPGKASQDPYAAESGGPPPPAYSNQGGGDYRRDNKSPAVTGVGQPYGGQQDRYGGSGGSYGGNQGYGSNRYDNAPPARQGGYGGLGRTEGTDAQRGALFGDAPSRVQQRQQAPGPPGPQGQQGGYGQSGAYGDSAAGSGYGGGPSYGDRELTQEEQEEEDVNATRSEIKFIKQQDVSSTRNALRLAQQAEETGRDTLARLGAQGERIHNTERNLDLASSQNRIAEERARELKTLNKSMFAMHVANPFNSSSRKQERDAKIMETHQLERAQRDATRKQAWESQARGTALSQNMASTKGPGQKSTLADRAKYQFEADSEDDEMENEIDNNLDELHGAAKRLNQLGRAMGQEVDTQNKHIDRIIGKTDKVDDQIALNRARLDRIH